MISIQISILYLVFHVHAKKKYRVLKKLKFKHFKFNYLILDPFIMIQYLYLYNTNKISLYYIINKFIIIICQYVLNYMDEIQT